MTMVLKHLSIPDIRGIHSIIAGTFAVAGTAGTITTRQGQGCFRLLTNPVRLQFSFSFGSDLIGPFLHPGSPSSGNQLMSGFLGNVDTMFLTVTFDPGGSVHGISKELKARLVSPENSSLNKHGAQTK